MQQPKIWYVGFPTYQYEEDVKVIAKERGLRIVDAKYKGGNKQVSKAPELTKKD